MAVEDPDLALVRALQAGEDRALETLIQRHQEQQRRAAKQAFHENRQASGTVSIVTTAS